MPRPKLARRFEPRYGVSQAALDVESTYVIREMEDHRSLSPTDIDTKRITVHSNCKHSWEHLQLRLNAIPDQERRIIQSLLFRDFYHLLELYLTSIAKLHPATAKPFVSSPRSKPVDPSSFSEWLFDSK